MAAPIGLVLAGGSGRRMGRTKGDLVLSGRPLAQRAAEVLSGVCEGVLISVPPGGANPAPGYAAIEDAAPPGRGPLAGIDAGFAATCTGDLLVLACDYPRVGADLLGVLLARAGQAGEIVLPCDSAGRDHPLVALWRGVMHGRVAAALARGALRVGDVVASSDVQRLHANAFAGIDLDSALVNVNWPEDLPPAAGPP